MKRFWEKVNKDAAGGCWLWTANKNNCGYGMIQIDGRGRSAHVWAYENAVAPIPEGYEIDHLCRNRACVNPAHMEAVTHRENCLRGISVWAINARKTHCIRGHAFSESNTYVTVDSRRQCRACRREAYRRKVAR